MLLPEFFLIQQLFEDNGISNVSAFIRRELSKFIPGDLKPGARIAVAVGSRNIANLVPAVKTVVSELKKAGAFPFILPAMGSHGGGTAEGQKNLLASLGITEASTGAVVDATAEAVKVGHTAVGQAVYQNSLAAASDGVVLVNRIKEHTSFEGKFESGIAKMLVVGLGNPAGAAFFHENGPDKLGIMLPEMTAVAIKNTPLLFAVALVENARRQTVLIEGLKPEDILTREPELLKYAKSLTPSIPFSQIDLLVVDEIGKNFSGTGMDTRVIGRLRIPGKREPVSPQIKRIVALNLSDGSEGNAYGVGLADFTTACLVEKMNRRVTYINALTTGFLERVKIPAYFVNAEEAICFAVRSLNTATSAELKIVRIKNTLELEVMEISAPLLAEVKNNAGVKIINGGYRWKFIDGL
jgi:hypothetical protein